MPSPEEQAKEPEEPRHSLPPRVALVHDWLTGMRGGEKVLEQLAGCFPGAPIFTLFHFPGSISASLEERAIHTSFLQRAPALRRYYRHYLPLFPAAIEDLDLAGYDLIVSTSHCVAKGILPPPGGLHLCYCHTPMRYAWDQERAYFPKRRGIVARLRGLALSALRAWDAASSNRVDLFLANSSFVAERIRRYYGRTARVLAPPVDVEFFTPAPEPQASEPSGEYCLIVSALAPYKRLDIAIRACEARGWPLKIVGTGDAAETRRLKSLAASRTEFLGRVDAERLRDLYRGSRCLLQPGVEDFGIAPVEALACGTPVVARGRGGVLDIVEDGVHGVLYDSGARRGSWTEAGEDSEQFEALTGAIDKSHQIRFNPLDLRSRAERFSAEEFRRRFERILAEARSKPRNSIS